MYNGLLLIVTPDTHHQNKNQPMMKSWRLGLEAIGFQRYCYEKDEHLHCMAYRKVQRIGGDTCSEGKTDGGKEDDDVGPHLLYIPQDFKDYMEETGSDSVENDKDKDRTDNDELVDGFEHLPLFDAD